MVSSGILRLQLNGYLGTVWPMNLNALMITVFLCLNKALFFYANYYSSFHKIIN